MNNTIPRNGLNDTGFLLCDFAAFAYLLLLKPTKIKYFKIKRQLFGFSFVLKAKGPFNRKREVRCE